MGFANINVNRAVLICTNYYSNNIKKYYLSRSKAKTAIATFPSDTSCVTLIAQGRA